MPDFEKDIKESIIVLKNGGTILYPTDTVWGLGCDALNTHAIQKIYNIKHRPKEKSMIVLLADARDILQYVAAPPPDIISIVENFDRPTTVIYNNGVNVPEDLLSADGSIAIRVIDEPFCKALIKRFGAPIVSTSANISGQPTPATYKMVSNEIINAVDYTVSYRHDDDTIHQPSRIVRINDDDELTILRP